MNEETPIDYIDIMARWLLGYAYELWVEGHGWESVPEIGRNDFDRICERAESLLPKSPTMREYQEAYNTLEVRAAAVGEDTPIVLDDYERGLLDRALDKMEGIGEDKT